MKKIKYLSLIILSLLGIGFSFGDDLDFSAGVSVNVLSFELTTSSKNIHYFLDGTWRPFSSNIAYNNAGTFTSLGSFYIPSYTGYGTTFPSSSWSSFFSHSSSQSNLGGLSNGNGLLILNKNPDTGIISSNSINYLIIRPGENYYNGNNALVSFTTGNIPSLSNGLYSTLSYLRFFYSPSVSSSDVFWDRNRSPLVSDITNNPIYFQKFAIDTPGFTTQKGLVRIPGFNSLYGVSPALSMGFGFFQYSDTAVSWSGIKFGTVFPFYDSYQTNGNYNLPSWAYTDKFYMFRLNGHKLNTSAGNVGVIAKCGVSQCVNQYSDVIYSEYNCNLPGNGLTFNTSSKYINLKESCFFVRGGVIKNFFPFTSFTGESKFVLSNIISTSSTNYYYYYSVPSYFFQFSNNNLQAGSISHYFNSSNTNDKFSWYGVGTFDNSVEYDILANFSNVAGYVPGTGEEDIPIVDTNYVGDTLDKICSSMVVKPPYCSNGLDDLGNGLEGYWMIWSGQLQYVVIDTNDSNFSSVNITANGSGSRTVECDTENDYFCSITSNIGSSQTSNYGSGFILSTGYYTDFFIKTGYRAKCPYPYTDWNIGLHNKVLNKVYNALNFDIFLPINCSIAAFTAGRNFQFLKDVNLGLSPLMGNIQGLDDPRNYLYGFFDFLLSLALFFFLMKIYKFFK